MAEFDINQIPEEHKHTQHINPGTDTTINLPYKMQDAYILKKEDWLRLRENITIGCTNQKAFLDSLTHHPCAPSQTERLCDDCNIIAIENKLTDTERQLIMSQQRTEQVIEELEHIRDMVDDTKDLSDTYRVRGISSCVHSELTDIMNEVTKAIALLQAGRK